MNRALASLIAIVGVVAASAVHAQATRTWVSGVGSDANPCSRTAPCQTFAGALGKTATNGEINCLDPGGFGTVNITKSITIDCGWTHGSILAANTNGVIVNGAGIVVTLRGLSINSANTTTGNGIRILNAAAVNVDDVVIENFAGTGTNGRGISIESTASAVRVTVQNSRIHNTNNFGIQSNPTSGTVILTVDNVHITRGGANGIQLRQNTNATINDSSVTNLVTGAGLATELTTVTAAVTNSNFSNNTFGVFNGNGGSPITRLYGTVITGNNTAGLQINSGQVISLGNNMIQGNTGNETPSSTIGTQ